MQLRFGFTEQDLQLLKNWIEAANIRWGLSAAQRESLGLPGNFAQNSWHSGMQRMLLGYATGDSEPWQGIAPCAQVAGLSAALAGQLAQRPAGLCQHRHVAVQHQACPVRGRAQHLGQRRIGEELHPRLGQARNPVRLAIVLPMVGKALRTGDQSPGRHGGHPLREGPAGAQGTAEGGGWAVATA